MILLLGWLLLAHPHAAPKTCDEWCEDGRCKCYDACVKGGESDLGPCHKDCNEKRSSCSGNCKEPTKSIRR